MGHTVRLIHAKAVRPFVAGNKTDATDARAIWLAAQQSGVKFVGVKTTEQQAGHTYVAPPALSAYEDAQHAKPTHCGLLYEFGATLAKGRNAPFKDVAQG